MVGTKSKIFIAAVGLILARFGFLFKKFYSAEKFKDQFELDDVGCELTGMGIGLISSEDLALGKYGILFITSGDLNQTFGYGPASASSGNIWMMNMKAEIPKDLKQLQLVKANIESSPGFSQNRFRFQPHGMDISNTTDRLYVINHNQDYSSVIIFEIRYNEKCLMDKEACPFKNAASLIFRSEITSSIFPFMALNDVVEASANEIYVTQWIPYPYPKRGKHQPDTIREHVEVSLNNHYAVLIFNYRWTNVFHCKWGDDDFTKAACNVATEERFKMANGITISPDRKTVFVNDPLDMNIMALARNTETGQLTKSYDIHLPSMVDNIEYDDEANEILLGNILPGGMAVLTKTVAGDDDTSWITNGVLKHDETKLKGISAAARLGKSKFVMGSPFSEGILVCTK